eukprot:scaffold2794_cov259-Alexandrium_tamarense.AAC.3
MEYTWMPSRDCHALFYRSKQHTTTPTTTTDQSFRNDVETHPKILAGNGRSIHPSINQREAADDGALAITSSYVAISYRTRKLTFLKSDGMSKVASDEDCHAQANRRQCITIQQS